jgi:haloalkane dehalogenase
MVPYLSDRFRCIAVDYPGFGLSKAPKRYGYTPAQHRVAKSLKRLSQPACGHQI